MIKLVSDLRQVGGFIRFPPTIKLIATIIVDIAEILLKVTLKTTTPTPNGQIICFFSTFGNFTFFIQNFKRRLYSSYNENLI